jgi:hypothetical protein
LFESVQLLKNSGDLEVPSKIERDDILSCAFLIGAVVQSASVPQQWRRERPVYSLKNAVALDVKVSAIKAGERDKLNCKQLLF